MILLVNREFIATKVQISDSVYDNILNEQIRNAQFLDVMPLMGSDFFDDLMRNSTDANYIALLDGGDYTYNGLNYTNIGLKTVITHYFNARYKKFGSKVDTAFGFTQKTNENSLNVSDKSKQVDYKQNQQIAFAYWRSVEKFLNRNTSDYTFWDSPDVCKTTNKQFRISKIS